MRDKWHDQGQDEVARARSLEQQSIPGPGISEEDALLPRRIKRPTNGADRGLRDREEQQGCLLASDVRPPGRFHYLARLVRAIVDPVQQSTFHVREVADPERASTRFLQTSQARHLITHTEVLKKSRYLISMPGLGPFDLHHTPQFKTSGDITTVSPVRPRQHPKKRNPGVLGAIYGAVSLVTPRSQLYFILSRPHSWRNLFCGRTLGRRNA